jgi:hypothetical protein
VRRAASLIIFLAVIAAPSSAQADTPIATERAPSKVSAELNRVVWSSYDPATGGYSLMSRTAQDGVTRLPVAARKVPFDVDLGYLGEGAEVATYSRCAREPDITNGGSTGLLPVWATGRGCDIYLFDFQTGREQKYAPTAGGRASEFLPTVSPAGRIAFARVYERRRGRRGRISYLYAKRGNHSLRRLPGGPRGETGLPGPTSLDLNGPRLAFGWEWTPRAHGFRGSQVRVDVVKGSHRTLQSVTSGLTQRSLLTPTIVAGDVLWGFTIVGEGDHSEFRHGSASGRGAILKAPAATYLVSAAGVPYRGGVYYLSTRSTEWVANKPPACGSPPEAFPPACTVAQADPVPFTR